MWMAMVFWIGEIVAPVGGDCAVGGSSVGAQWEVHQPPPPLGANSPPLGAHWEVTTGQLLCPPLLMCCSRSH